MFTSLKRVFSLGWSGFWRNGGQNTAAVFAVAVTICLATALYFFYGLAQFTVSQIQNRVNVSVYFREDAREDDVLTVKEELLKLPEIKTVQYVSQEQALERFKQKYQENPDFMKALEEIGGNPFPASLEVVTKESSQYFNVANFLETGESRQLIDNINYYQNKPVIDKIFKVTANIQRAGLVLAGVLVLITILIFFNTLKLTVANSKEEIETMKSVGSPAWFIKGIFVVQGAAVGLVAALLCFALFFGGIFFLAPQLKILLSNFDLFQYFLNNLWLLVLIQAGIGLGLGIIGGLIVIAKHLKEQ